jgi:tRNA pseudouridine65 synthase
MFPGRVEVLYRDGRVIVVDKRSGTSVHRGWDAGRDTVMHQLRARLGQWVYPVHRLDRATSGALVVALDREAASKLAASFREGRVEKEYLALVRGVIDAPGVVDWPLPAHGGRERVPARTEYEPIGVARDRYTLVRLRPQAGRRHQLRRHMKHLSRPILGDTTYGDGRENRKLRAEIGLHRLALHASWIAFPHPETGARIEARAPLPPDLREPLERLGIPSELLAALSAPREAPGPRNDVSPLASPVGSR